MKVSEFERSTTPIGARVNSHFINLLKESDIAISSVVESMIGYFFTLSDEEKVKMIYMYSPQSIDIEQVKYPKLVWSELEHRYKKGNLLNGND